jgi:hypothetical protein
VRYSETNAKAFYLRAKGLHALKNFNAALSDLMKAKSLCNSNSHMQKFPELDQYITDLKRQVQKEKDQEQKQNSRENQDFLGIELSKSRTSNKLSGKVSMNSLINQQSRPVVDHFVPGKE